MAPLRFRRVRQQTWALTVKNALVFSKSPVVSIFRALVLPVAITVVFCFLKYIKGASSEPYGISYAGAPVLDLPTAMSATPSHRLVFSLNGIESRALNDTIHAIGDESGMGPFDIQIIDEPTALYDACRQSIQGTSECFAAVIFTTFDDDNAEYIMALDEYAVHGPTSYKTRHSILTDRLLPLQWAIDSHLGNFTSVQRPTEKMWHGHFGQSSIYLDGPYDEERSALRNESSYWLQLVKTFVAPIFTLILIPLAYHVSTAVANERQTGLAELMMAQGVTVTPRVLSNFLSFFALYLPGVIASSIFLGEVLFVATSTGLVFILVLLASLAVLAWSHVIGSLFSRAQLAGLCGSILTFVVGLIMIPVVMLTRTLAPTYVLSVLFPPYAWATLIQDIAGAEAMGRAFPDPQAASYNGNVQGDLYFLFFIVQIVLYIAGVYAIECWRWTLPKKRDWVDGADDVALRLSHLSKTFSSKNAVDDLSLDVQKGSVTFLLGPNGSGKTTVLNCISRMMRVDEGSSIQFNRDYYSFGLCPQSNVSDVVRHLVIMANWLRSCGIPSLSRNISESGASSRPLAALSRRSRTTSLRSAT
jgi:ATP-binding cassette subfamily A (ABC1) protein 3